MSGHKVDRVVIVGAGHAGVETADALRRNGYVGDVVIVERGRQVPYQRPPLSKDFVAAGADASPLPLRAQRFYDDTRIELRLGTDVTRIDRHRQTVELSDGDALPYRYLVLATGAHPRRLSCAGIDLEGVAHLHTLDDAVALRAHLDSASRVVVVGAGFIGLEFASTAAARGLSVTVLDVADRPMSRVLSEPTSHLFHDLHAAAGVRMLLRTGIRAIDGVGGRVSAVVDDTGTTHPADLVLVGIGVVPETSAAAAAELLVDNGIVVDEFLRTGDPHIFAIGDCASFPSSHAMRRLRLEAVQNATDQARCVASTIAGTPSQYQAVPWFWTVQCGRKLQIAGLPGPSDETIRLGDPVGGKGSTLGFTDDRLAWVESIGAPADHLAARSLLAEHDAPLSPAQAGATEFTLKGHARQVRAAAVGV